MIGDLRHARLAALLLVTLLAGTSFLGFGRLADRSFIHEALLSGEVRDDQGPLEAATVRFKGEALAVVTDSQGRFQLPLLSKTSNRVTVSKEGYLIAGATADSTPLSIRLTRLPADDTESYQWVDPTPDPAQGHHCGNCHGEIHREWAASGHARSVHNRHFLNLYEGSDWSGRPGAGWNLLAEHPDGAGVCTACHAPSIDFTDPAYYDLRKARGPAAHGVHCDYCHKIADVTNDQFGLTHGRFGLKLLRPAKGQLFFGPLDDVDRGEDTCSPLYRESRYCASCHEGIVFGVPVYTTYSEWLASPARREGKQCQTCHMTPTGTLTNIAPGRGGLERDPKTLVNHRFFAPSQREMLRQCLKVNVRVIPGKQLARAEIAIRAEMVGHRVPTGFADRNLILVVEAFGPDGKGIPADAESPLLPAVAGKSVSGLAGRLFAKQLSNFEGKQPVPFWRAQPDVVDTRLTPGIPDRSSYTFSGRVDRLRVRLLHRRVWEELAHNKSWPDNEIVILNETWPLSRNVETNWSGP